MMSAAVERITVPAQVQQLEAVISFVSRDDLCAFADLKQQMNIELAVEEIFVNIVSYAFPGGAGEITLERSLSPERMRLEFRDRGVAYNPLAKEDPDISLDASERQPGGLGIFLTKQVMDVLEYRYENGENIFTMTKNFTATSGFSV